MKNRKKKKVVEDDNEAGVMPDARNEGFDKAPAQPAEVDDSDFLGDEDDDFNS